MTAAEMTTDEMYALIKASRDWAARLPKHPDEEAISQHLQDFFSRQDALLLRALAEASKLRVRLAAWEAHEMRLAKVVGHVFEQPSSDPEMTPDPAVVARVEQLVREHAGLRERVKELELLGLGYTVEKSRPPEPR